MKEPESKLARRTWVEVQRFYRSNSFMQKVICAIIDRELNEILFASTSHELLNISDRNKNSNITLRIDNSGTLIHIEYFKMHKFKISEKYDSEVQAVEAVFRIITNNFLK